MNLLAIIGLTFCLSYALAEKIRFDNYTVYRIVPQHDEAVQFLKNLEETAYLHGYNFWTSPTTVGRPVDLMVPPHLKGFLSNATGFLNMESKIMMHNVQDNIDNEGFRPDAKAGTFGWTSYHTLDEINTWLRSLPAQYPDVVTLILAGYSFEGRPIYGIKVSYNYNNRFNSVFMDANIHAREWITSATLTYILNELLSSKEPLVRQIAESHDWYVFPVINPDGFEFSHTTNRMWRKTRVPYGICHGVDPNRNWKYMWNSGGSSNNPCQDTYHGPEAFSEPSTLVMSQFIDSIGSLIGTYLSFHSYSQMLLMPYGYTTQHLDNYYEVYQVGKLGIQALAKRYGTQYKLGNVAETIYIASGSSMDWVKGVHQTPIAFTYELRDLGSNGFLLPAEQIIPSGLETLDSVLEILAAGTPIRNKLNATRS